MTPLLLAREISLNTLKKCSTKIGIVAGGHHFVDLWGRDSLFATFGANAEGLTDLSKKTIETFLSFQRKDGLIPYRVQRSPSTLGKYRGKPKYFSTPRPNYRSHQSGGLVLDGGLITVMAVWRYSEKTGDREIPKKWYPKLSRALNWYEKRAKRGLLAEWVLCEWADAVLKLGKTLYTNALYWAALGDMAKIARLTNHPKDAKAFLSQQKHVGIAIKKRFWNGKYFSDWFDWTRQDYFASHANMLCVIFGLATQKEAISILKFAGKYCRKDFTLETNYPKYPLWRIPVWNYLAGMGDYHNGGCLWLQPGILYSLALKRVGQKKKAKEVLVKVAKKIVEYKDVFEVYEKSGKPVNRFTYESEHPFAWSAGLFLWARKIIAGPNSQIPL